MPASIPGLMDAVMPVSLMGTSWETFPEDMSGEELLRELEELQQLQARVAARELDVIEQLHAQRHRALMGKAHAEYGQELSQGMQNFVDAECDSVIRSELRLALGLTVAEVRDRFSLAVEDPERHWPLREAMAYGELSLRRAATLSRRLVVLPQHLTFDALAKVLAPYPAHDPDGRGGLRVPHDAFTARLGRFMCRHDTDRAEHKQKVAERNAGGHVQNETGTGEFWVTGHAGRVTSAVERIDRIARRVRSDGDTRTLAQLRSDIALDLLLHGGLPQALADQVGVNPESGRTGPASNPTQPGQTQTISENMHPGTGPRWGLTDNDVARMAPYTGALPPARVTVTISAASLLGATDEPGTVDAGSSMEYLPAHVVRDLAYAAGSVWRRLVTDPVTGYMADLSTHAYAVTGHLRERVMARDRISRVPGAVTPAWRCDTDHDLDYAAGGPSSESNLSAKSRHGHNHKTRGTWTSRREPSVHGTIEWTTGTGRKYVIRPWDYRDPDHPTTDQMLDRAATPEPEVQIIHQPAPATSGPLTYGKPAHQLEADLRKLTNQLKKQQRQINYAIEQTGQAPF